MNILISGATGFVGQGVLAEALGSSDVGRVVSLGRKAPSVTHPKLTHVLVDDMGNLAQVAEELAGIDACFWCLGVSSNGMNEETYSKITHDFTLHAAELLLARNDNLRFCFVSGSGADGNAMWARVKKKTEDDLAQLNLGSLTVFRPAYIRGLHGAQPRGALYKLAYGVFTVLSPLIRLLGGGTSNAEIGRAMIVAARDQLNSQVLDSRSINEVAARLVA